MQLPLVDRVRVSRAERSERRRRGRREQTKLVRVYLRDLNARGVRPRTTNGTIASSSS
jgi:hypothetical protein